LKHSETFDISHDFLPLIVAKLSTLKQVQFLLDHPVYICKQGFCSQCFIRKEIRSPAVARTANRTGCQWPSRSSKTDDFHVIWKLIYDYLSVINSNLGPISHSLNKFLKCLYNNLNSYNVSRNKYITFKPSMHWILAKK